ncbi:hypothetical protein I302_102134 [Kwoniella bestiolae CBS 10118]|uniref:Nucleotide-diphospho-sugar transferase domain-containing protein n=1 Tax=Kwoniella bestiolae CBS 10118 TaxID=1296100 RepID=A0A1B9GED3_9TREE|nr:hypothetical protein I302_00823 [Kwoniella bestiolae CBS 10118]OCF29321.1 hypothetical protein I302_00823 [Kwoniella bestiolae CBS 10118]
MGYLFPSKDYPYDLYNSSHSPTLAHELDEGKSERSIVTVTATSTITQTITPTLPSASPTRHPIIILQHLTDNSHSTIGKYDSRLLLDRSPADHERHAKIHGYRYIGDNASYVEEKFHSRRKSNNKIHVLMKTLLVELGKPEGERAEWVFVTDADTVIYSPSIPLHHLIPSSRHDLPSETLFLGIKDFNGFNNGNMFLRVNRRMISFLAHALSKEEERAQKIMRGERPLDPHGRVRDNFASDQEPLSLAFLSPDNRDIREGFYKIPCHWVNFYPEQFRGNYTQELDELILQVHYPNFRKWTYPLQPIVSHAEDVYSTAIGKALNEGLVVSDSEGLELMEWYDRSRKVADEWWRRAKNGIEGIEFTTI